VTGNGTVTINNTVIFTVNADMQGFSGTVSLGTSSNSFRFNSGGNSSGAQQSVGSSNAVFDLGTGAAALVNRNGGNTTYYLGALAGGPNTQVRGSENSGSPSIYQIGDRNLNATFAGSIRNGLAGGSTPQASAAVTLLKVGTGTLTLTGTNTYSGSTTVSNGVLALSDGGMIGASPTLNVVSNTVLDASGRTDGAITLNTDQTLLGEGTVRGSVIAAAGSTVAPGAASGFIGKLLITNALTFQSGSTNAMDLDTVNATNDVISGLASITFGGTLAVGGDYFSVTNGSSFRLFNAAFYQGAFDSIVPALPVPGLMWDTSSLAANGILKVTLQRPTIGSSGTDGSTFVFRGTLGTPFGTYFVLSSTNLTDWTPVLTNLFEADGSFAYTNAITPGVPKQFFRLQTP
jgi:autotransporter-associated beta strand protein